MKPDHVLDASGHLCPVPILMTEEKMTELQEGEVLEVVFTDIGAKEDLLAWCKATGNPWLGFHGDKWKGFVYIRKGQRQNGQGAQ